MYVNEILRFALGDNGEGYKKIPTWYEHSLPPSRDIPRPGISARPISIIA